MYNKKKKKKKTVKILNVSIISSIIIIFIFSWIDINVLAIFVIPNINWRRNIYANLLLLVI